MNGKSNITIGFLTMGLFMAYGFLLIYLRDFAPGKSAISRHFASKEEIIIALLIILL